MKRALAAFSDPMIAVLVLATGLAFVMPATGSLRAAAQTVSSVFIFLLFLVNGMRIARSEILSAFGNWRFFLPLVVFVFGVMAALGKGFSVLATDNIPPELALGFVFLGVLPSTIQSATSYTNLAEGNAALSVVGAALLNILGVFVSAPLFALLGGGGGADIGSEAIVRIALILLLPFAIGQALQGFTRTFLVERKSQVVWLDRLVIGIAVYVAMSGAVGQGLLQEISAVTGLWLAGLTILFLVAAHGLAWAVSGWAGYPRTDRIAFLYAGGQKSVAIGAPMAAILFDPHVAGFVIAPLLLYHLMQLLVAAPLAAQLANRQG